jgi:hypothetical protein
VKERQRHAADMKLWKRRCRALQCVLRNIIATAVFAAKFRVPSRETSSNARARFWFQLVETMIRNHIDERQLNGVE